MAQPKPTILVVDDDERWLERISKILKSDYEVTVCDNDREAIDLVGSKTFALVVLDMKLANGVSGLDVFEQMQRVAKDLPAIMLTGFPARSSMRDSFKKGVMDYLEKASANLAVELPVVVADMISKRAEIEIRNLIGGGEGQHIEMKTSVRWDSRSKKVNKELTKNIIKTIAGFLNSSGGTLLLGVDDRGDVVGIEADYETLARRDRDGYEGYLTKLLLDTFGKELSLSIRISFHEIDRKLICSVTAQPAPKPVFVPDEKGEHFYVRTGNSTRLLSTREAIEFCKVRWKE